MFLGVGQFAVAYLRILSFYFKIGDADQLIPKRDLTLESSDASHVHENLLLRKIFQEPVVNRMGKAGSIISAVADEDFSFSHLLASNSSNSFLIGGSYRNSLRGLKNSAQRRTGTAQQGGEWYWTFWPGQIQFQLRFISMSSTLGVSLGLPCRKSICCQWRIQSIPGSEAGPA